VTIGSCLLPVQEASSMAAIMGVNRTILRFKSLQRYEEFESYALRIKKKVSDECIFLMLGSSFLIKICIFAPELKVIRL
jgi:hypothetical protein